MLCILEKAYDKTLRAHVVPPTATSSAQSAPSRPSHDPYGPATSSASSTAQSPANSNIFSSQSSGKHMNGESPRQSPTEEVPLPGSSTSNSTPLMEGSSTALLAILEHPSVPPPKTPKPMSLFHPQARRGTSDARTVRADRGAVLRIAHLGDCMAMLIRGEEIIWRTEEMWWNVRIWVDPRILWLSVSALMTHVCDLSLFCSSTRQYSLARPRPRGHRMHTHSRSPCRRTIS